MLLGSKISISTISLYILLSASIHGQEVCVTLQERLNSGNLLEVDHLLDKAQIQCPDIVGQIYLRKGNNELAEKLFNQTLKKAQPETADYADALNNLGIIYWNTGSASKGVEHVEQALKIRQKLFGDNHEKVAASYNDLGLILNSTNTDLALDYYESALKIYRNIFGNSHEKTAQGLINTGIAYRNLELYGDASINFNEALKTWKALYPDGHPNEGFIHINIGQTKQQMQDLDGALKSYQEALNLYKRFYGEQHPEVASTLNLIGNINNIKGEFEEAINLYQQALIANTKGFNSTDIEKNPNVSDYLSSNTLLNSLFYKSKAFADLHFNKTLKFSDLKLSLSTLQSCDTLVDKIRQVRTNEADKIALGQLASSVYETGVELCKAMGDVVIKKDEYYALSFYFAEKSKSAVLLEAIADAKAKSFAGMSNAELEKELFLKSEIAFLENSALQEEDDVQKGKLQSQLLEAKTNYNQFIEEIEEKYPKYFALKYNTSLPTIEEVQSKLSESQTMLSYFWTENSKRVYIFEITADKFKLHNNPQTEEFDKYISGFRNGIYFRVKPTYTYTASELYDIVIPKRLDKNTTNLIIVPAGRLGTIPFEALLTDKVKDDMSFAEMPYLINEYSISYSYASALFVAEKPKHSMMEEKAFLCAPVNFTELPNLPGSKKELEDLNTILTNKGYGTESLLEANANESEIKVQDFRQYKYVHLATHGLVNESNPALSRIYFNSSLIEDGNLFTGEIYNLQFDTDLVTLSACQTGLGKLSKGEGVIGLSRALLYAGANNLVVSLWSVSDDSTADLMKSFYENMNSSNYGLPLKLAKTELIKTKKYAEPYFWAPFILIGK
ncbi:CHAT domain-containing protein [Fulvivirga lutea]|uniref:CHAT domain-containing protein n=1 Tax=Fulvivirga lutea TaxID=2810512 RepID=A0A974WE13_9BACT|nr:CHAT domain-containing tetratricopeptide repeat protein [Fulvivirga lutea]QSE96271.1 CHAT domain-containing protein [Fulvivirga lutea]